MEADEDGAWPRPYCYAIAIGTLAGRAVEEEIGVEQRYLDHPTDDAIVAMWIDRLRCPSPELRREAREALGKAAATAVRESLPQILAFAAELLRRVREIRPEVWRPVWRSKTWSVVIEGEELRQLLPG